MSIPSRKSEATYQRLPTDVVPNSYLICLKPNYENFSFEGSEIVHLTVNTDTSQMILNASDLTVGKIMWEEDVTENRQEPLEYALDVENELLKIIFEPPLSPSQGMLRINFSGNISIKGEKGLYRSKHVGGDGHVVFDLATGFESTNARRCFPCWDEPSIKATFEICLILPRGLTAISNMPVKVTYPHRSKKNLHVVEFMRSPVMSPYLLCMCVGDFEFVWTQAPENILCHVYTERGKKKLGKFALDLVAKMLPFFNCYFGIPFSLPKLDLVALSENKSTALEHWGCITVRDVNLLGDTNSSGLFFQNLYMVIAHELSHQWMGNLVTMNWFNVLWLQEGMATFFEYLSVDHFSPQFDIWSQFIVNRFIPALNADCSRYSRPIEPNITNSHDIVESYDNITYGKGAALLRMLYHWIGEKEFRDGICLYLEKFQFKSANSEDLFSCFEQVCDKPVKAVMSTWVSQPGFPLIKDDQSTKEKVASNSKEKGGLWTIPITFSCDGKPELMRVVMEKKSMTVNILIGKTHWVDINPELQGYFRVKYAPECFTQFLSAVRQRQLPVIMSVLEAYIEETHYSVWRLIIMIIQRIAIRLDTTDFHSKFMSYGRFIFSNIAEKTSWDVKENEDHLITLRRTIILSMMIFLSSESTVTEARKRFELFTKGESVIPPDLRICVFQAVLSDADDETIKTFMRMYHCESASLEEKEQIAKALGSVKTSAEKINAVLDFSITEEVRTRHTALIIAGLATSKVGRDVTWQFFKDRWNLLRHRFGGGLSLNSLIRSVTENFSTEEKAMEITNFFKDNPYPGTEKTVQQCVENIRLNDSWLKRELGLNFISDYLSSYI